MLEKDELKLAQALQGLNLEELVATLGISQLKILDAILDELKAIRQATETEAVEDSEPDPFQTLNGP